MIICLVPLIIYVLRLALFRVVITHLVLTLSYVLLPFVADTYLELFISFLFYYEHFGGVYLDLFLKSLQSFNYYSIDNDDDDDTSTTTSTISVTTTSTTTINIYYV